MIKRLVFDIKHLDLMDVRSLEKDTVLNFAGVRYILENMPINAGGLTLVIDGRIIACFGYYNLFEGTAEVWLIPSIYVQNYMFSFVKSVESYLKCTAETFQWKRVQTVTRTDNFHRRWMQALGFVEEGTMKKYYKDLDFIISARYF